ncbi:MAG: phenylalanine--tRNA ligase subunit alpha [Pseudomonadota bacterium]
MTTDIIALRTALLAQITAAETLDALEAARVAALGKKGRLTDIMKTLGGLEPEARRQLGQDVNVLKDELIALLDAREATMQDQALNARLATETIDITLPVRPRPQGSLHPISQTMDELLSIFADMGFSLVDGPDIEDDFHNFTALNFPPGHPAREMHDTFYLQDAQGQVDKSLLLRTHTSTVQVRTMISQKPPLRVVCQGRTYRSDYDMTHTPMFHQMEGMYIDKDVTMSQLKTCLMDFVRIYFNMPDLEVRFRPSFFPFTEPSAEMDVRCSRKDGKLVLGTGDDWLEVLGCGMIHPNVLKNCGIDPDAYRGFAFGMGIERFTMLKYGIPDLRTFFESDLRWLRHYGFSALDRPTRTSRIGL